MSHIYVMFCVYPLKNYIYIPAAPQKFIFQSILLIKAFKILLCGIYLNGLSSPSCYKPSSSFILKVTYLDPRYPAQTLRDPTGMLQKGQATMEIVELGVMGFVTSVNVDKGLTGKT